MSLRIMPLLVVAALLPATPGQSASAQFVREEIAFRASAGSCAVDALYEFRNAAPHDVLWPIFYPLLHTSEIPRAESIHVSDPASGEALQFEPGAEGISFSVAIPARRTRAIRITYRQPAPAGRMEYILTTTQRWDRPLERAVFRIQIPDSLKLLQCSVPHDSVIRRSGETEYLVRRERFMPRANLGFRWERREP